MGPVEGSVFERKGSLASYDNIGFSRERIGIAGMMNHGFTADRLVQLMRLRSDQFGCAADRGAGYATSDKDASVVQHGSSVILSRLRHCAKKSELTS